MQTTAIGGGPPPAPSTLRPAGLDDGTTVAGARAPTADKQAPAAVTANAEYVTRVLQQQGLGNKVNTSA